MFKKILIANRGEIAVRIIEACWALGVKTVAVFSEEDRESLHVSLADEAICIGEAEVSKSYLNIDAIIHAAKKTGAEAIHPGYGFLSENYEFAQRCEAEQIAFVGPDSESIKLMGNKLAARAALDDFVPMVPGFKCVDISTEQIVKQVNEIGYPVIVKAAAGGGGKGMKLVGSEDVLIESVDSARREALSAFGVEDVFIEKYLERPRHVEFQVVMDHHGNGRHLLERECSIQRRHQKLVEEAPSPAISLEKRREMGAVAVAIAKKVNYKNVGTVEFLLDEDGSFYFLEMNTRIQVEHPITEMVTGVDLVKWQIRIAAGETLDFPNKEIFPRGHSIECRIYAEDPEKNFLPSPGKISFLQNPSGSGIRNDQGVYSGSDISAFYDPIMSKLVVWGENREAARKKMIEALKEYIVLGVKTNIPYLKDVLSHEVFITGSTTTSFVGEHMNGWKQSVDRNLLKEALFAAAIYDFEHATNPKIPCTVAGIPSVDPWSQLGSVSIPKSSKGGE
jgi:acetyl-CoA carboxylase biotin carboxylase subunit